MTTKIKSGQYKNDPTWKGWVETKNWILFEKHNGDLVVFNERKPNGAVIGSGNWIPATGD